MSLCAFSCLQHANNNPQHQRDRVRRRRGRDAAQQRALHEGVRRGRRLGRHRRLRGLLQGHGAHPRGHPEPELPRAGAGGARGALDRLGAQLRALRRSWHFRSLFPSRIMQMHHTVEVRRDLDRRPAAAGHATHD